MRATVKFFFLLLLSAASCPVHAQGVTEPRFRDGDVWAFPRYVMQQLTFPVDVYVDGEPISFAMTFWVTKKGAVKDIESVRTSNDLVTGTVARIISDSGDWGPAMLDGKPIAMKVELNLDMILNQDADGKLRPEDVTVYSRADQAPSFEGGGPAKFREWVQTHVGDTWPDGSALDARAHLEFVVEKDGSIGALRVSKTPYEWLDKRIAEVLAQAPRFSSAVAGGEAVRFRIRQRLAFGWEAEKLAERSAVAPLDDTFLLVEKMPTFRGGNLSDFRQWVMSRVRYPDEALRLGIRGLVLVEFVIDKDGSLTLIRCLRSPCAPMAQEVLRVLRTSPRWTPGMQGGECVRVKYTQPVHFHTSAPPRY